MTATGVSKGRDSSEQKARTTTIFLRWSNGADRLATRGRPTTEAAGNFIPWNEMNTASSARSPRYGGCAEQCLRRVVERFPVASDTHSELSCDTLTDFLP